MLRRTYVLSLLYASTAALLLLLAGAPAASLLAQAAGISSPGPGAAIVGDVPIIGTAVIDSFQKYELHYKHCLLYTSPSPRDRTRSRMPSSA